MLTETLMKNIMKMIRTTFGNSLLKGCGYDIRDHDLIRLQMMMKMSNIDKNVHEEYHENDKEMEVTAVD